MNNKREKDYDGIRKDIERQCILTYKPKKCYTAYTLFSSYMGNIFYLINMEGNVVHTWRVRGAKLGEILPDEHLMYGHMWNGLVEIDWNSKELWYYKCSQHHDFAVMPNGHALILCGIRGNGFPLQLILEERRNPKIRDDCNNDTLRSPYTNSQSGKSCNNRSKCNRGLVRVVIA